MFLTLVFLLLFCQVIYRLVERRREVKKLLKREQEPIKQKQLDIRQKALKLVANSMYGCLGFVASRFYCEPLAALITSQGRDILQRSVELTNSLGAEVIYGDTDSIMVHTNEDSIDRAIALGTMIKKEVNKRHKILEIDIDGIFKNMLLLRKKKYAALKVIESSDNTGIKTYQREVKGLDLVRRDWCRLSKDIGDYVLNQILSGNAREEVVENIHSHLNELKEALKSNQVSLDKFIITKGMTKAPKDYPDARNQPHVQVALQLLSKGKNVKAGDFIDYIVCEGDSPIALRSFHPSTIQAAEGALSVDIQWYLANQVLPPVARLCGPIEETDAPKLAHHLGLDPKQFQHVQSSAEKAAREEEEEEFDLTELEDEERFKKCKPLMITCQYCNTNYRFNGILPISNASSSTSSELNPEQKDDSTPSSSSFIPSTTLHSGLHCPTSSCSGLLSKPEDESTIYTRLCNTLVLDFRSCISHYYAGWYRCNDSSCSKSRTRDISIAAGNKCNVEKCNGRMEKEVKASELYLQLQYYDTLFDVNRALKQVEVENKRRGASAQALTNAQAAAPGTAALSQLIPSLSTSEAKVAAKVKEWVNELMKRNDYHYLPPSIFATSKTLKR